MSEIVYVLTNPVIPDLVKIGKTEDLERRVRDLSRHAGVPMPFEVHYACTVSDMTRVERHLLNGFGDHRINPRREFLRINPERIVAVLKLLEVEDVTPNDDFVEDQEEQQSLDNERSRRETFKFSSVGIELGAVLSFVRDEDITATVVDDRTIEFEGEPTSLSQSAQKIMKRDFGKDWKAVQGPLFWVYKGETLSERRLRLESSG